MPHLTLEYTHNVPGLNPPKILNALNQTCLDSGLFGESDIKARAVALDCFQIGVKPEPRAFVHLRMALLSGRTPEQKKPLSDALIKVLMAEVGDEKGLQVQFSVEIVDMERACYAKENRHG